MFSKVVVDCSVYNVRIFFFSCKNYKRINIFHLFHRVDLEIRQKLRSALLASHNLRACSHQVVRVILLVYYYVHRYCLGKKLCVPS